MGIEILSKEGCQYCDFATNLCIDYGLEYKKDVVILLDSKVIYLL